MIILCDYELSYVVLFPLFHDVTVIAVVLSYNKVHDASLLFTGLFMHMLYSKDCLGVYAL